MQKVFFALVAASKIRCSAQMLRQGGSFARALISQALEKAQFSGNILGELVQKRISSHNCNFSLFLKAPHAD